jgi:hypothetical protein
VPLEAIPGFITRLQALYAKATGQRVAAKSPAAKKAPAGKGPAGKGIGKKKKMAEKRAKPAKMTIDDLDADLVNYTSARGADGAPAEAAAPAEA